jgi:hypothetical protein
MAGNGSRGGSGRSAGGNARQQQPAAVQPEMTGRVRTSQLQRARSLSDEKVGRVLGRIVNVTKNQRNDGRVRAANRVEVRVRAGNFIREAGLKLLKTKAQPEKGVAAPEAYRFALSRRNTYGTQRQNRNRPVPYDRLLQSQMRGRGAG